MKRGKYESEHNACEYLEQNLTWKSYYDLSVNKLFQKLQQGLKPTRKG